MHVLHITIFTKDGELSFEPLTFLVGLASLQMPNFSDISNSSWNNLISRKISLETYVQPVVLHADGRRDLLPRISICAISLDSICETSTLRW